jgi:hypothetical protein
MYIRSRGAGDVASECVGAEPAARRRAEEDDACVPFPIGTMRTLRDMQRAAMRSSGPGGVSRQRVDADEAGPTRRKWHAGALARWLVWGPRAGVHTGHCASMAQGTDRPELKSIEFISVFLALQSQCWECLASPPPPSHATYKTTQCMPYYVRSSLGRVSLGLPAGLTPPETPSIHRRACTRPPAA